MNEGASGSFHLIRTSGDAAAFHARVVPDPTAPEIWWHEITAPAVVLGSSQSDDVVDRVACASAGVDVVRRRSGGGAVLLVPGEITWIDVVIPRGGPGWAADVHAPMRWVGEHLVGVVAELMPDRRVALHAGAPLTTRWSSLICFDGVGVGEVLLDGAKLVGISQRRTRAAARLQCCWHSAYDAAALVGLLAPDSRPPIAALAPVATVPPDVAIAVAEGLATRLATSLR